MAGLMLRKIQILVHLVVWLRRRLAHERDGQEFRYRMSDAVWAKRVP